MLPFSLPLLSFLVAVAVAQTIVDDADPNVFYAPASSWRLSSTPCTPCLQPILSDAYRGTFHDGTGGLSDRHVSQVSDAKGDHGGDHDGDSDDVDPNLNAGPTVTATVEFTGVQVSVFCIVPTGNDALHITASNLTFSIDGVVVGHFLRAQDPVNTTIGFLYKHLVFNSTQLTNTLHELVVSAPPASALFLDYISYTPGSSNSTSTASAAPSVVSPAREGTRSAITKKGNVTFGVAVGSSVGVLSLITFAVCASLICRRRRSARRNRARTTIIPPEGDMLSPDAELDDDPETARRFGMGLSTPAMQQMGVHGPVPFVPRYFPGTVIPPPPPAPDSESMLPPPSPPPPFEPRATGTSLSRSSDSHPHSQRRPSPSPSPPPISRPLLHHPPPSAYHGYTSRPAFPVSSPDVPASRPGTASSSTTLVERNPAGTYPLRAPQQPPPPPFSERDIPPVPITGSQNLPDGEPPLYAEHLLGIMFHPSSPPQGAASPTPMRHAQARPRSILDEPDSASGPV